MYMYIEDRGEEKNKNKHHTTHTHTYTPIYVKYFDHVLFRNADPDLIKPILREALGWLIKEDNDAIWILFDKTVNNLLFEKFEPSSGLIILKRNIIEMKNIE